MKTIEQSINIHSATTSRVKGYDFDNQEFGQTLTDHMLIATYKNGSWMTPVIEPVHDLTISPMALCLHYGQTVFEGMKAYRHVNGDANIFRLDKHFERFNRSLERMCMPHVPRTLFEEGMTQLVALENAWISDKPGHSLYLRPFMIATEPRLGVKISDEYIFAILCSPIAPYFNSNVKVKVETEFSRAVAGGAGYSKNGGNYGAALYPTLLAKQEGFDQVLWTDAIEHLYIEESGVMNVMIIIDGKLITPALSGTILDGVTRDSILTLAREDGMVVEERRISYKELERGFIEGCQIEIFGVGTAAVIAPIELISIRGARYYPKMDASSIHVRFQEKLQAIRTGRHEDRYNWNHIIVPNQGR